MLFFLINLISVVLCVKNKWLQPDQMSSEQRWYMQYRRCLCKGLMLPTKVKKITLLRWGQGQGAFKKPCEECSPLAADVAPRWLSHVSLCLVGRVGRIRKQGCWFGIGSALSAILCFSVQTPVLNSKGTYSSQHFKKCTAQWCACFRETLPLTAILHSQSNLESTLMKKEISYVHLFPH